MRRSATRKNKKDIGVNILGIGVIVLAAMLLGFLMTKFIIYPIILGDSAIYESIGDKIEKGLVEKKTEENGENSEEDRASSETDGNDKQQKMDSASEKSQNGYCIQFGSFSTKTAADELLNQLKASGINASITEKDGTFKVIGELFGDKDAARSSMETLDRNIYKDVFVTYI